MVKLFIVQGICMEGFNVLGRFVLNLCSVTP